jgi:hypothetical protein
MRFDLLRSSPPAFEKICDLTACTGPTPRHGTDQYNLEQPQQNGSQLRLYGPLQPFFAKTWRFGEIEPHGG